MNLRRAGAACAARIGRAVRPAVVWAVAAVAVAAQSARAQDVGDGAWHPSAPPLMQVTDVDALVRIAGATLPREALFAAYERYLQAWRASADAWGPRAARADVEWAAGAGRVFGSVEGGAALVDLLQRSAADRAAIEGALFAELASAVADPERDAVRRAQSRRELRVLLGSISLETGDELVSTLVSCDLETALDDALRDDPAARAAVREAIAPFAARRRAAAQDAAEVQRREPLLRARWAAANGWGELTSEEAMQLRRDAWPPAEGEADTPERSAAREVAGARLNELYRAYGAAAEAATAPARPALGALARVQLEACRAALQAVATERRWALLYRILSNHLEGTAEGVLPMDLFAPLHARGVSGACEACVHRALARWREESVDLYLRQFGRAAEALGKPPEEDELGNGVVFEDAERERSERIAQLLADCGAHCPDADMPDGAEGEGGMADQEELWARLERIPELTKHVRSWRRLGGSSEDPEADEEPGGTSPYDFWSWSLGMPDEWGDAAWPAALRDTLASLGVDKARLAAVDAIATDHAERWAAVRMAASEAVDAAVPEDAWASAELLPAVERAEAQGRKALAAEDAVLLAAIDAAFGDAIADHDRALLAVSRALGDARREATARPTGDHPVQSLRVNPADVVLAAGLSPQARARAADVLLGRAPSLAAVLAAARTAHVRATECGSSGWRGMSRRTPIEERAARRAMIEAEQRAALERERACRAAFDDAIEATCAALGAEDAARIRATADRRRYPDAHRPEASLRALWGAIDAQIPPEQAELRVSVVALFDRLVARAEGVCRESIRRAGSLDRRLPISASHADRRRAESEVALGSFQAEVLALRLLAIERIRDAVPREVRARCRDWGRFGRAADARWQDPDLDSGS
ncbi:MAG: hypothetical protein FJ260_02030 [Planctomycetes bacterium]|nr:hypothetical protein [Planctomycetota bacterium]